MKYKEYMQMRNMLMTLFRNLETKYGAEVGAMLFRVAYCDEHYVYDRTEIINELSTFDDVFLSPEEAAMLPAEDGDVFAAQAVAECYDLIEGPHQDENLVTIIRPMWFRHAEFRRWLDDPVTTVRRPRKGETQYITRIARLPSGGYDGWDITHKLMPAFVKDELMYLFDLVNPSASLMFLVNDREI